MKYLPFLLTFLSFSLLNKANATHNRAGEITFKQIGATAYEFTVTTYTKASSIPADRDSLELFWGDGNRNWVLRSNGPIDQNGLHTGELIGNNIRLNKYTATYAYASPATYMVYLTDPNRNSDIININSGASDQIAFHLATELAIPQSGAWNNSPTLLEPPIDNGNIGQAFTHNPNAYDIDGDSLSFELVPPRMGLVTDATAYQYPDQIMPGPDNNHTLDQETGQFNWESPQMAGEYNIAYLIKEYRNGQLISSVIRDMQITIGDEPNRPPVGFSIPENITLVAGENLQLDIIADDLDAGQLVRLGSSGGPYLLASSPAQFSVTEGYQPPPLTGSFSWTPTLDHVRTQPYLIVFKVEDDYLDMNGDPAILARVQTLSIKVVAEATGIKKQAVDFTINPFPNPSTGQLQIDLKSGSLIKNARLCLSDIAGKILLEKNYSLLKNELLQLDLEGIPTGMYFLNFSTENGILSKKILVEE